MIIKIKSSNKANDISVIIEDNGRLILECDHNVISIDKQDVATLLAILRAEDLYNNIQWI